MSTATYKRTLAQATADAKAFYQLLDPGMTLTVDWQFAGSLRRRRPEVGDVEHVTIPRFGDIPSKDLFATPARGNLLWHRLDDLVNAGTLAKATYSNGFKWGEKYRGVSFNGFTHEIFTTDVDGWGSQFVIRTGPAEFSQRMVTALRRHDLRNHLGHVWQCKPCKGGCDKSCEECEGTHLVPIVILPTPDEREYFRLCRVEYVEPERRG